MTVQSALEAARLWGRHSSIPVPGDLRDDEELRQVNSRLGEIASALRSQGRLSDAEQAWLRSVRPDLHRRLINLPPGAEKGYVESLVMVIDALLTSARLT
jgi:hypothetical protein